MDADHDQRIVLGLLLEPGTGIVAFSELQARLAGIDVLIAR
jgi:hypothetical protein